MLGFTIVLFSAPDVLREHSISDLIIGSLIASACGSILAIPVVLSFYLVSKALYSAPSFWASRFGILALGTVFGTLFLIVPAFFGMPLHILKFAAPIIGFGCAAYCLLRENKNEH